MRNILVVSLFPGNDFSGMRLGIYQHLHVLDHSMANNNIYYYNAWEEWQKSFDPKSSYIEVPPSIPLNPIDVVILHTTFLCYRWLENDGFYQFKKRFEWIKQLDCVKIALPQDEYDHAALLDEWLCDWDVSGVFTVCHKKNASRLYPIMQNYTEIYEALTGYIDPTNGFAGTPERRASVASRPYDIVYRATCLPFWFGSHGQLKYEIADVMKQAATKVGLKTNISTRPEDTVLGEKWIDFLASGRCTIGCESGSSVIDYRGEIQKQIKLLLRNNPELSFAEVASHMPDGWDDTPITAISPRHFEAVATKTCQILIEGEYNGIFQADRHYVSLKRDYSNLAEVLDRIKDVRYTEMIAQNAYDEIFLNAKYSYKAFAAEIEKAIDNAYGQKRSRVSQVANSDDPSLYSVQRQVISERHQVHFLQLEMDRLKAEHQAEIERLQAEHRTEMDQHLNDANFLSKRLLHVLMKKWKH